MFSKDTKIHKVLVSFPDPLYEVILYRAHKIGMSFSEYIRFIAVDYLNRPDFFAEIQDKINIEKNVKLKNK